MLWRQCLERLEGELSAQQFNTWIRPLQAEERADLIMLLAPNRFVVDWIREQYFDVISRIVDSISNGNSPKLELAVGSRTLCDAHPAAILPATDSAGTGTRASLSVSASVTASSFTPASSMGSQNVPLAKSRELAWQTPLLNPQYTFGSFVEGKSNQLARAASEQVAENLGGGYNPLFICGGVGLGKTHLMHAVGAAILSRKPEAKVVYLRSEQFVGDMVKALQHKVIDDFKRYYRSVDALLIDDIQFFAGKERSQEEFFHTFNALLEGQQQILLTCDRYPKEVEGLEERLKSRFSWGLTVAIDPPELETRVAILKNKALRAQIDLPDEVAFFVAKRFRSNIRDLEGALNRVIANAHFKDRLVSLEFAKEALKDLLALQEKLVTIENIQKTAAEYYKIRIADLISKRRSRSIARPRQVAMTLAKELTSHSLPEIGDAFGGRDHTTVIHACRKIAELRESEARMKEDYSNLLRILST